MRSGDQNVERVGSDLSALLDILPEAPLWTTLSGLKILKAQTQILGLSNFFFVGGGVFAARMYLLRPYVRKLN